jgi:hypothetical protein
MREQREQVSDDEMRSRFLGAWGNLWTSVCTSGLRAGSRLAGSYNDFMKSLSTTFWQRGQNLAIVGSDAPRARERQDMFGVGLR